MSHNNGVYSPYSITNSIVIMKISLIQKFQIEIQYVRLAIAAQLHSYS